MNRTMRGATSIALVALCAVLLLTATPVAAQITCTSPNSIYWSPPPTGNGNNNNDGATTGTAVATLPQAETLAAQKGGGCIYLALPGTEPNVIKQVYATTGPLGVPLAQAALYGLLLLLAAALVAVGLWARRKSQNQPHYQSQA